MSDSLSALQDAAQTIVEREFDPHAVLSLAACDYAAAEAVSRGLEELPRRPGELDAFIAWQTLLALRQVLAAELEADRELVDSRWENADGDETWRESLDPADLDGSLDRIVRESARPDDQQGEDTGDLLVREPPVLRDRFDVPDDNIVDVLPELRGRQPKEVYETTIPHYARQVTRACIGEPAMNLPRLRPLIELGVLKRPEISAVCVDIRELARQLRYPLDSDETDGMLA